MLSRIGRRRSWSDLTASVQQVAFASLLILVLAVDLKGRAFGSLSWLALWHLPVTAELVAGFGPLALLPGLAALLWLAYRLLESPRRPWCWGRWGITLPLLGLTGLVIGSMDRDFGNPRTVGLMSLLGLTWFVYLYVANERPNLAIPLALTLALQGTAAVGQFLSQRDWGLSLLGEPPLDRAVPGVSVLVALGQRWLRAYGLTGHPNLLGLTLAVSLLLLLPALRTARGFHQAAIGLAMLSGFLGLLASFSRASWLGFGLGAAVWVICCNVRAGRERIRSTYLRRKSALALGVLVLLTAAFVVRYYDLVASRFLLQSGYTETISLTDRSRATRVALSIFGVHPWQGVGAGSYLEAALSLDPKADIVHNVPLLVAAELGLAGAALWLWLVLAPLWRPGQRRDWTCLAGTAPWLAYLAIGLFDYNAWPLAFMRAAVLFGLLAGQLAPRPGPSDRRST